MKRSLAYLVLGIAIVIASPCISYKVFTHSRVGGMADLGDLDCLANALYWIGLMVVSLAIVQAVKSSLMRFVPWVSRTGIVQVMIQVIQMTIAFLGVVVAIRAGKGATPLLLPSHGVGLVVVLVAGRIRKGVIAPR